MSERPMLRVGAQLQPQRASFAAIREAALALEALGLDTLFGSDHFVSVPGDREGAIFECWTTLAALAEATERVELGPLVSCASYRNANLLADTARTVDHVAGGRLILGLGAGWFQPDYSAYGYAFGTWDARLTAFEHALIAIEERLPRLNPPPVRGSIPILIGGGGERRLLRLVAEHADIWNVIADPDTFARKSIVLDRWCVAVGRDPAAIERSVLLERGWLDHLDDYLALGARHLIVDLGAPPWPLEAAAQLVEWRDARQAISSPRTLLAPLSASLAELREVDVENAEMALRFDP